jgi:hypothetical protein
MMGLVLTFAGFLIAYRYRTTRRLLWSVPLILAGLFFKQQFLATPLAVFLFLMVEKQYRRAAEFSGLLIGGGFALLGYFQYGAYPGQAVLLHLLKYNAIRFSWQRLGYSLLLDAVIFGVPTLLAFEFLRRHPDRLLMYYLACALVLAVGSSGKQGSGIWYFLEPLLLVSPLLAGLIAECRAEAERYVEILCLLAFTVFFATRVGSAAPNPEDFARDRAVQDYLRQHFPPGTIGAGSYAGEIVRARLEIRISDLFQYTWLVCQGTIPAADLLGTVEQRRIGVFLFSRDLNDENDTHQENGLCMTEKLHQAILRNYRLATTLPMPQPEQVNGPTRFYVWVPRP